jgi:hypothetical protein
MNGYLTSGKKKKKNKTKTKTKEEATMRFM